MATFRLKQHFILLHMSMYSVLSLLDFRIKSVYFRVSNELTTGHSGHSQQFGV